MNFGLNWGGVVSSSRERMFAMAPGTAIGLGNDEVVFRTNYSDRTHVMTRQVLRALEQCHAFYPLEHHVRNVCQTLDSLRGQEAAVRQVLESMARRGVLIELSDYIKQLEAGRGRTPTDVGSVIIRTCNRPAALRRCLESIVHYEKRWSAMRRYWVFDDSDDVRVMASNAERVRHFSEITGCDARTFNREEIKNLSAWIYGHLDSASVASSSALLNKSPEGNLELGAHYGRSMNWLMLLSAGQKTVWVDDDQQFDFRWHPGLSSGFQVDVAMNDPRVYSEVGESDRMGNAVEEDPLALHLRWCGSDVGELLTKSNWAPSSNDWFGLSPTLVQSLQPGNAIISTLQGYRGDSATVGVEWLLALPKQARESWCNSRDGYLQGLQRPEIWHGSSRVGLSSLAGITPFTVDAGEVLPAVPRQGRGEDAVFATLVGLTRRNAIQLELPLAISHRRDSVADRRPFAPKARRLVFSNYLIEILNGHAGFCQSEMVQDRIRYASEVLLDFSGMSSDRCGRWMHDVELQYRAAEIQRLQRAVTDDASPAIYWLADARALIEANGKAVFEDVATSPIEWPLNSSQSEIVDLFQSKVREYALGLRVWPELFEIFRRNTLLQ